MYKAKSLIQFRKTPGLENCVDSFKKELRCRASQAFILYRAGFRSIEEVLNASERDIQLIPRIGPAFLKKWLDAKRERDLAKDRAQGSLG